LELVRSRRRSSPQALALRDRLESRAGDRSCNIRSRAAVLAVVELKVATVDCGLLHRNRSFRRPRSLLGAKAEGNTLCNLRVRAAVGPTLRMQAVLLGRPCAYDDRSRHQPCSGRCLLRYGWCSIRLGHQSTIAIPLRCWQSQGSWILNNSKASNARLEVGLDQAIDGLRAWPSTRRGSLDLAAGSPEPEDLTRQKTSDRSTIALPFV
jgi:hypothetical protein